MGAPGALELIVVGRSIGVRVVLVVNLLHDVLLIVIAGVVMVAVVAVALPRHLRRRDRAVDARHRLQHPFQGVRVEADAAVLRVLDTHVVGALALRLVPAVVIVDDVEDVTILHLQLGVVGRPGMVQLLLAQRLALQGAARLRTLRLQHLGAVLLSGCVLALFLRFLRRYRGALLVGAVDLSRERRDE